MFDLAGIFLFIVSLAGAIKGLNLPIWIPQVIALMALILITYQGAWKHSRLIIIHSGTLYVALIWIGGHLLAASWGMGLLSQIPIYMLLLTTPLAAFLPHQARKRFRPAEGKKLELTRTETSPLKEWWLSLKRKSVPTKAKQQIELIVFDLGEEIDFQNK